MAVRLSSLWHWHLSQSMSMPLVVITVLGGRVLGETQLLLQQMGERCKIPPKPSVAGWILPVLSALPARGCSKQLL